MSCVVGGCRSHSSRRRRQKQDVIVTFHRFPKEDVKRNEWRNCIGRQNWTPKKHSRICSKHFTANSFVCDGNFKFRRLRDDAIPTLFYENIISNEMEVPKEFCKEGQSTVLEIQGDDHQQHQSNILYLMERQTMKVPVDMPQPILVPKIESLSEDEKHHIPICRACLRTDCKLVPIQEYKLVQIFTAVIDTSYTTTDMLPQSFCIECVSFLEKLRKFQSKARNARKELDKVLREDGMISSQAILKIGKVSGELSMKHLGPDHCDASFDYGNDVKLVSNYDFHRVNDNKRGFIAIKVVPNNFIVIGNDDRDSGDGKNDVHNEAYNQCEIAAVEHLETYKYVETIKHEEADKDEATSKHVDIHGNKEPIEFSERQDVKADQNIETTTYKPSVECINEIDQFDQAIVNYSDLESDSSIDGTIIKEKCNEEYKVDVKNRTTQIKRPIKNYAPSVISKYFTIKTLSFNEQMEDMEKLKTSPKFCKSPFICELCCKGFVDHNAYKSHMVLHSEESGSVVCEICKYRYKSRRLLGHHIRSSHKRLYSCKLCVYTSKITSAVYAHLRDHQGKMYECKVCDSKYRRRSSYVSHMRLAHPSKHVCALCAKTFLEESGLKTHVRLKHALDHRPIPEDGPVCDACNVKFVSKDVLTIHIWTAHSGDKSQVASRGTRLDEGKALGGASRIIARGKCRRKALKRRRPPPPCSECGKQFSTDASLVAHLRRLHPNSAGLVEKLAQRSYLCDLCGVSFHTNCSLNEHKVLHSLGGLSCDECNRSYETKQGLKNHKETAHSGVTHACSICRMTFTNDGNRKRHEKYFHRSTRSEACQVCGKTFKCAASKHSHEQHVHYNKPWPVRKRDRASERKRRRAAQKVMVEESGEKQADGSEQGLNKSQPKRSGRKTAKRNRQTDDEDGTDEESSE